MPGNWGDDNWGEYEWGYEGEGPETTLECFEGPLTSLEEALLSPFIPSLPYMERLRQLLLDAAVSVPDPVGAVRSLYQRLYNTDVAVMLRRLVPEPTSIELASYVCYKQTQLEIYNELQKDPRLCEQCLSELGQLRLPKTYIHLLQTHLDTQQPNDIVPLTILFVFLAKVLEQNILA